ncbi:MAG TPA: hypothetical protein VEG60_08415 [Candidatus Binatia bacterium]|nr:hypothetical protein [Candidatus Binatia bacterium]
MAERTYIIPYSTDARKRHYHKTARGRVTYFAVQLEVKNEGEWRQVVRYDCSHKFVHRDSYDLRERQRKEAIDLGYEEALTFADEDLDENWERYQSIFLRGERP